MNERTHASFFSGAGGLDLGLERAGWRTVSFSEIDPYACAVLAERWPGVPNLGDIVQLAGSLGSGTEHRDGHGAGSQHEPDDWRAATAGSVADGRRGGLVGEPAGDSGRSGAPDPEQLVGWDAASRADLWTGGFPCQDLSVAGKRRGMGAGTRSGLAYAFLALAERHRPRWVLLENVPGLLSSHGGRDMAALIGALVELGYGVGYRMLDARYFGVPQRRRRVFILGDSLGGRAGAERASEVLSVGSVCQRHPPTGRDTGAESPRAVARRAVQAGELVGTVDGTFGHHGGALGGDNLRQGHVIPSGAPDDARGQAGWRQGTVAVGGREPDPSYGERSDAVHGTNGTEVDAGRNGTPDGLAGRLDDRAGLAATLNSGGNNGGFRTEPGEHLVVAVMENQRGELRTSEQTDSVKVGGGKPGQGYQAVLGSSGIAAESDLLPLGLDSHRYRCCGNGVVADVGEWVGRRLMEIA